MLVATGRRPNSDGFGLEQLGVTLGKGGAVEVDERMRAADGVWAIGDVNAIAMFTHVGKYQARVAAADMAGQPAKADHSAVPAVTFTDPQVASVGRTSGAGLVTGERQIDSVVAHVDLRAAETAGVPEGDRRPRSEGCWWARSRWAPRRASGWAS